MPKIREVRFRGYRRVENGSKKRTYVYTRKVFYFPVAFEKELVAFRGIELFPHVEDDRIVLESRKRRSKA